MRVRFNLACPDGVRWTVMTVANRRIGEWVERGKEAAWNLQDGKGDRVAPGLYYLVFSPGGGKKQIKPIMVLPD